MDEDIPQKWIIQLCRKDRVYNHHKIRKPQRKQENNEDSFVSFHIIIVLKRISLELLELEKSSTMVVFLHFEILDQSICLICCMKKHMKRSIYMAQ